MASASAITSPDFLSQRFADLILRRRSALVAYITAGHPSPAESVELIRGIAEAGADVIEVGVPFSDPLADGPVIQASSQRALEQGVNFDRVLEIISRASVAVPIVLFSYLNPILSAGRNALARAAEAGAHGILITDLPVGADTPLEASIGESPLAFVRLVAPTTPPARMAIIARHGRGFVYLISRLGVTGVRVDIPPELPRTIALLRENTTLPICVGFGIAHPQQAAAVARLADGVVVGSALVREAGRDVGAAVALTRALRHALDQA